MNFPIELYVAGTKRTVVLEDLSRTGMFVRLTNDQHVEVGSIVHAAMAPVPGHARVLTAGTVVHAIDESEATRLGRVAGIGVRFRDPINVRDEEFAQVITEMVGRHIKVVHAPTTRIVVGDHHPRVVEQLSGRLARAGFAVAVATTGLEVLSACHRHAPDVVLVDRALPLIDGFDVVRELAGTPVIMSSYDHSDFARAFELGASDFLPKPYTVRELVARARRLVRANQRIVLRGSLTEVAMPVLLTMLEQARKTGKLALVGPDGQRATVELVLGRIVDARCGAAAVRDVLMTTLDWTDGTFELAAAAPAPATRQLSLSVTHLLLEHARVTDERRAS